jgi:hypothetical protein
MTSADKAFGGRKPGGKCCPFPTQQRKPVSSFSCHSPSIHRAWPKSQIRRFSVQSSSSNQFRMCVEQFLQSFEPTCLQHITGHGQRAKYVDSSNQFRRCVEQFLQSVFSASPGGSRCAHILVVRRPTLGEPSTPADTSSASVQALRPRDSSSVFSFCRVLRPRVHSIPQVWPKSQIRQFRRCVEQFLQSFETTSPEHIVIPWLSVINRFSQTSSLEPNFASLSRTLASRPSWIVSFISRVVANSQPRQKHSRSFSVPPGGSRCAHTMVARRPTLGEPSTLADKLVSQRPGFKT